MLFIVPKLGKILVGLGGPDAKLPVYTQILLNISSKAKSGGLFGLGSKKKVKLNDLVIFTRQLATMVGAGALQISLVTPANTSRK